MSEVLYFYEHHICAKYLTEAYPFPQQSIWFCGYETVLWADVQDLSMIEHAVYFWGGDI